MKIFTFLPLLWYLVLPLVFILLGISAALWEKRQLWAYVAANELIGKTLPPPSPYYNEHSLGLQYAGFIPVGTYGHGGSKLYDMLHGAWLSPNRDTLAVVSIGKIASMQVANTALYSLLENGSCLATHLYAGAAEVDLTGLTKSAIFPHITLNDELERHRIRIATQTVAAIPFSPTDPLQDYRHFVEKRVALLVQQGKAKYIDDDKSTWRYTVIGAFLMGFRQFFKAQQNA